MPFSIIRNDITQVHADAIVNTANPRPIIGAGTDAMLHQAAGPRLLAARKAVGDIAPGSSALTPAYRLHAKYVIHTVGPLWCDGTHGEEQLLRSCYDSALKLALEKGCRSIAFPLISTGHYGFPRDKALQIAISAFSAFLLEQEMQIWLVVFDRDSFRLSEKLFQSVTSYIDEHYVGSCMQMPYPCASRSLRMEPEETCRESCAPRASRSFSREQKETCKEMSLSLEDMLKQEDAGFTETLLKRIDETGKKDSEIYKKANISKQHFSKIRNNPHYKPTKATALALALALELDLEETKDLIGRAGYALTNSSKFDLILRFYIEKRNYNIIEINMVLYEFDQPLLGA